MDSEGLDSNTSFRALGISLANSCCGGYVDIGHGNGQNGAVFYTKKPPDSDHALLQPGVVLLYSSEILKGLCVLTETGSGIRTNWTCKKKGSGRLYAKCCRAGNAIESRGSGKRARLSMRVGCSAFVTAVPLTARKYPALFERLSLEIGGLSDNENGEESPMFCIVQTVNMSHVGHVPTPSEGEKLVLSRRADAISHPQIRSALHSFLRISHGGPGSLRKASQYIAGLYPHIHVPKEAIRNTVAKLRECEDDASTFAAMLKDLKYRNELEFLRIFREENTGTLTGVVWSFLGSKDTVRRCGDIVFWDSTHNMTRYDYKVSCFTIIDSEGSSRAVLFAFLLSETAENCKILLSAWHEAFNSRLPRVIFTDGDEAMYAAISSIPYSSDVKHLICLFHLFDMNVKKKVQPVLTSISGGSSWAGFRKGLSVCREAQSEGELERLWYGLLEKWLPKCPSNISVLAYLNDYVWSKRQQWAVAYFNTCFTFGATTTQRSESWNSLMKAFSDTSSLVTLFHSLKNLTESQKIEEERSRHSLVRTSPLRTISCVTGGDPIDAADALQLSRFCCDELRKELSAAFRMRVSILNETSKSPTLGEGLEIEGIVQYTYTKFSNDSQSRTKVKIVIGQTTKNDILLDEYSGIYCECFYTRRLKIPCRHALCVGLDADHRQVLSSLPASHLAGSGSVLAYIIRQGTSARWKSPYSENLSSDELLPKTEPVLRMNATEKEFSTSANELYWPRVPPLPFPLSIRNRGGRQAYSILIGQFRALAEVMTSSTAHLPIAFMLTRFADRLQKIMESSNFFGSSDADSTPNILRKCIEEAILDFNIESSKSPKNTMSESPSNAEDEIEPVEPVGNLYASNYTSDTEVKNPPLRRDSRKSNKASTDIRKSRSARNRKKDASRKVPVKHRPSSNTRAEPPNKPRAHGYACPKCTSISVMNNPYNVRQHFMSAHSSIPLSSLTLESMQIAAQTHEERSKSFCASEKRGQKRKSSPKVRSEASADTEEPDDIDSVSKDLGSASVSTEHAEEMIVEEENSQTGDDHEDEIEVVHERELISHHCQISKKWFLAVNHNTYDTGLSQEVEIGSIIEIFWPQDLSWYRGKVIKISSMGRTGPVRSACQVSVLYEDGDEEDLEDLNSQKWRMIYGYTGCPDVTWELDNEISDKHFKAMEKAQALVDKGKAGVILVVTGRCPVDAEDYCSLRNGMWLTDAVIEAFGKAMLRKSVNAADQRILLLSSHTMTLVRSNDTDQRQSVSGWLDGIELHDIDMILWPICFAHHWRLCVAYTQDKRVIIHDPFNPEGTTARNRNRSGLASSILEGLEILCQKYKQKYKDGRKWHFEDSETQAMFLNLPKQPSRNGSDCGVLVCLYMWAYITAMPWPSPYKEERSRRKRGTFYKSFSELMIDARVNIGAHIVLGGIMPDEMNATGTEDS